LFDFYGVLYTFPIVNGDYCTHIHLLNQWLTELLVALSTMQQCHRTFHAYAPITGELGAETISVILIWTWRHCHCAGRYTDKNREKIMIKRQTIFPNFLKLRIFLSKLANNYRQSWQKYKIGDNFPSFSSNFPMIFVSVAAWCRIRWVQHFLWYKGHLSLVIWAWFNLNISRRPSSAWAWRGVITFCLIQRPLVSCHLGMLCIMYTPPTILSEDDLPLSEMCDPHQRKMEISISKARVQTSITDFMI